MLNNTANIMIYSKLCKICKKNSLCCVSSRKEKDFLCKVLE